jgi:hypothetical protein
MKFKDIAGELYELAEEVEQLEIRLASAIEYIKQNIKRFPLSEIEWMISDGVLDEDDVPPELLKKILKK